MKILTRKDNRVKIFFLKEGEERKNGGGREGGERRRDGGEGETEIRRKQKLKILIFHVHFRPTVGLFF